MLTNQLKAKIGRKALVSTAMLLTSLPAFSQGWVQHNDKNGFRLSHPPGWVVETPDALLITTRQQAQDVGKVVKYLDEKKMNKLT